VQAWLSSTILKGYFIYWVDCHRLKLKQRNIKKMVCEIKGKNGKTGQLAERSIYFHMLSGLNCLKNNFNLSLVFGTEMPK